MLLVLYRRREVSQLERLAECEVRRSIKKLKIVILFLILFFLWPNFEKDLPLNSLGEVVALFLSRTTP